MKRFVGATVPKGGSRESFLLVKTFSNRLYHHKIALKTSDQQQLLPTPPPPLLKPPPSPRSSSHANASCGGCRNRDGEYTGSTTTTTAAVATLTNISHLPLPPPAPPPPESRPCGECCVRQGFSAPGECSFHAKAAVALWFIVCMGNVSKNVLSANSRCHF